MKTKMKKIATLLLMILLCVTTTTPVFAAEKEEEDVKTQNATKKNVTVETVMYTNEEVKLLACLIQAEAGNQSFRGKVAVGNVVLNRVKSPKYPNTIKGVIYDKRWAPQFSVTVNGSLKNKLANYNKSKPEECIKAAKAALNGTNYVGSYMYFRRYTRDYANQLGKGNYKVIGAHIFH